MAQNRKPPAFQVYAADELSRRSFKLATLAERGLIYTIKNECWVNGSVPADPIQLAKYLGIPEDELELSLTENVLSYFQKDGDSLICPELEDYRKHLDEIRIKKSEGGKQGAKTTNTRYKRPMIDRSGNPQDTREMSRDSLVEHRKENQNQENQNQVQSIEKGELVDECFLREYEETDDSTPF